MNPLKQGLKPLFRTKHKRIPTVGKNSESIKTRIETSILTLLNDTRELVRIVNPLKQGLEQKIKNNNFYVRLFFCL